MNGKQEIRKRYGFAGWKRIAVAFCLLAAGSVRGAEEVIFSADFNRPESVKEWKLSHWHTKGEKRPVRVFSDAVSAVGGDGSRRVRRISGG